MRVLYIDGVGPFGGASRSLFELVRAARPLGVQPYFLATKGTSLNFYSQIAEDLIAGRGLSRFDNTLYSHYRKVRWLILAREMYLIPFSVQMVLKAYRRWKEIDLIHVNEILEIGPAILAKKLFRVPLIVHVRSVQNDDLRSRRSRAIFDLLRRHADAVIAIDENVRASLPADIKVAVINNSFTPKSTQVDGAMIQRFQALRPSSLKVGFVGNLHHSKGLYEMLEAACILKEKKVDVEMVMVGGTTMSDIGFRAKVLSKTGLAQNVRQMLEDKAAKLDISDIVHFFGPTQDIKSIYDRIDVICFASHYDAPGRPVFEAAFAGVPSITAVTKPHADTIIPDETGICIEPRNASQLADAIIHFAEQRDEVRRMGENARKLAQQNFDPERNALKLLNVYRETIDRVAR